MEDVETAQARLNYAKSGEKYRAAKQAFQADVGDGADPKKSKKLPAFAKARTAHVKATDDWRNNHRTAPDGEGDGTVGPEPVTLTVETS